MKRIHADDHGIWFEGTGPRWGVAWSEVQAVSIALYEPPQGSSAVIVELEQEHGDFVELESSAPGFDEFVRHAPSHLSGLGADWFADPSERTAWRR
jgi:hypothetical protein